MPYLRNNFNSKVAIPKTVFNVDVTNNHIIFNFEAEESCLYSFSKENNSDLWRACVCEIFLELNDEFYYEFEVAPNGATFIAKIRNRVIEYFDCNFFSSKVKVIGNTYHVMMDIDLNKLGNPKLIKYNAFRVETKPNEKEQNLSALNPTLCGTFHAREKFISLKL